MFKRIPITLLVLLFLFTTFTISAAGLGNDGIESGGFWSPPETVAPLDPIDMERGNDGIIHIIGVSACCPFDLLYSQRDLSGSWSSPETITADILTDVIGDSDLVVASDGTAHVTWPNNPGGGLNYLYYSKRLGVNNWTPKDSISDPTHDVTLPTLLINTSDELYASWISLGSQAGLYMRKQTGGTWTSIQRVDSDHFAAAPHVHIDSQQNLHYFWFNYDLSDARVYYRKQFPNDTFDLETPISDLPTGQVFPNGLVTSLDGQNLAVSWALHNNQTTDDDIYFAEFTEGDWSEPTQLNTTAGAYYPEFIGASGNNIYLIVEDTDSDTFSYWFRPSGGSWTSEPISFLGTDPNMAFLVTSENLFHMVWDDDENQIQYLTRKNLNPWSPVEIINGNVDPNTIILKEENGLYDLVWQNYPTTYYSYGGIFNTLETQGFIPVVFK